MVAARENTGTFFPPALPNPASFSFERFLHALPPGNDSLEKDRGEDLPFCAGEVESGFSSLVRAAAFLRNPLAPFSPGDLRERRPRETSEEARIGHARQV